MEKRDIDIIRVRFKAWSGGFPPSNKEQVQLFCQEDVPAQYDQQEVYDYLLTWLKDVEAGVITLPSGLEIPKKYIMDVIDSMISIFGSYGFTDWDVAVDDAYKLIQRDDFEDITIDTEEDLEAIDLLIGPIAAKFKDEMEHAYDVAYQSYKRQSDRHVDAMLKKWATEGR